MKVAENTNYGATFRVIIWIPDDNDISGEDTLITPQKILWEASVLIQNGQIITTGGFRQDDFASEFTNEEIIISPNNKVMKLFRITRPSERLRHHGFKLDIERDIKQPLLMNNPRSVPIEVIQKANVDNIAITAFLDVGYGTYIDVFSQPFAKTSSTVTVQDNTENEYFDGKPMSKLNDVVFNTYPQPFFNNATVMFKIPETRYVIIEVFNIEGRLISVLFDGLANKEEEYSVVLETDELPSGIYICRFKSGKEVLMRKLLKAN